jgi:hypothetical protein
VKLTKPVTTIAVTLPLLAACANHPTNSAAGPSPVSSSVVTSSGVTSTYPTSPAAVSGSTAPTTDADRLALATKTAAELVGEVQLPSDARPQVTAPASGLTQPPTTTMSPNEIDSARWFTVSGTVDSVVAYAQAHPPKGLVANGSGSGSDGSAEVSFEGQPTVDYDGPSVDVEAIPAGSGVAVRVDAQVVWLPVRTAAEFVPSTVTGATAVRTGATNATVQVSSTEARSLARLIDALATRAPGERHCPSISYTTAITFEGAGPSVFTVDGCGGVTVTAAGVAQPTLADSENFGTEVDKLFGVAGSPAPASSPAG